MQGADLQVQAVLNLRLLASLDRLRQKGMRLKADSRKKGPVRLIRVHSCTSALLSLSISSENLRKDRDGERDLSH